MFDCLELVCAQIAELERERDAVLEEEAPDKAEVMIQQLAGLRGIGVQSATCWSEKRSCANSPMARRWALTTGSRRRRSADGPRSRVRHRGPGSTRLHSLSV
jgi:hypothetical protein